MASATSPQQTPFNKDSYVTRYGALLHTVTRLALVSTALFSLNWFLGVCALTWASTVILGGLLSQLGRSDFFCVSALLLLEALRLAAATFFGNLVTRKLIYRSTHPALIKYDDQDRHHMLAFARVLDQTSQLMVLAISVFLPLKRLPSLPRQARGDFDGLYYSLCIFYALVLLNATIAVAGVLHSKTLVPLFMTTFSLRRYYDHTVWRGMQKGFLYATDFDILVFAYDALAEEYRRNLRASVVYALYHDLIDYLYAHNYGFDAARIAMDSNDHCVQEAAANIVGLWAQNITDAGSSLLLQSRLITKLADALDHQQTGRAATSSFESLAKSVREPKGLLEVKNERGDERLMAILSKCIGKAVEVNKADKAIVFMKVLIQLLKSEEGRQEAASISGMEEDVRRVFRGKGCKKRTVAVAGKALKQMKGELSTEEEVERWLSREEVERWLGSPQPSEGEHILEDEADYIKELLGERPPWLGRMQVRRNTSARRSPSSTNTTSCIMGLLLFFLIVLAVILCLHKTKF